MNTVKTETGETRVVVNGKRAAYWTAFLRTLMPWMVSALTASTVFFGGWMIRAEIHHEKTEKFMAEGQRFHSDDSLPGVNSSASLIREVDIRIAREIKELEGRLPPDDYRRLIETQLGGLQKAVDTNSKKLDHLLVELQRRK